MTKKTLHGSGQKFGQDGRGGPIQVFYTDQPDQLPLVSHASGIYMWDTDGKRYLDASSGPVVSNLGHGNEAVISAMTRQANKVSFASRAVFRNQANQDFARLLVDLAGPGFDQVFIVSGGSEATEAAIKLARQHAFAMGEKKRWKVLARDLSYHGASLGAVSVTGDPVSEEVFSAVTRVMPKIPVPFSYRLPVNHDIDSYARYCAEALETAILQESADTVLAFIMEPVGGLSTGGLVAPDHYYGMIRDICTRHGVLLIFDEVMSGAGRTGKFLSAEYWPECRPDIVTLAKGIAAGYTPFGAVLVPDGMVDKIVEAGGLLHGHTYSANPLSCAVGYAVLREMLDRNLMDNAAKMGGYLRQRLEELQTRSQILGDVRGKGLLLAIEIVADKSTKAMLPAKSNAVYRLLELGIERGLLLYSRKTAKGIYGEWLMVTPPLTITKPEIDELVELLHLTLSDFEQELRGDGTIPLDTQHL